MEPEDLLKGVEWLGHAGFRIVTTAGVVYVDPWRAGGSEDADVILITHDHFDHFSREDVVRLSRRGTQVVAPATVTERLRGLTVPVTPGEAVEAGGVEVRAVAAYNTNKLDSDGRPFHGRDSGWVGYVITDAARRIYHSGDTDVVPEMDEAAGADVALLPVSGTYAMTAAEAVEAARRIAPGVAVPMHWGALIGSRLDAERFAADAPCPVRILDPVAAVV